MGRLLTGMAAGAIIGSAVSVMMMPEMNKRTTKSIRRAGRKMMNATEGAIGNIMSKM